jgi:hypothetical protein
MTSSGSSEEADFWPFLITRGHRSGFRVVAAPGFLCDAGLADLLWESAGGPPMAPGQARRRVVKGSAVGDFAVLFRVRLAGTADAGAEGERLRDEHGRPVPVVEGVVERVSRAGAVSEDVLSRGAEHCAQHLRDFWRLDRAWPGPAATPAFRARRAGRGVALAWEELGERWAGPRPGPARPPAGEARKPGAPSGGDPPGKALPMASDRRRLRAILGGAGAAVAAVVVWAVESRNR